MDKKPVCVLTVVENEQGKQMILETSKKEEKEGVVCGLDIEDKYWQEVPESEEVREHFAKCAEEQASNN